jgi:glycosyltransferase involved in cell wall biosynthesis
MRVLVFTTLYPNNVWPTHGVFVKERMTRLNGSGAAEVRVVAPVPWFPPIRAGWRYDYSRVARRETIDGVPVEHPRYALAPKIGMSLHGLSIFLCVLPAVRRLRAEFDFDLIDAHFVYPDGLAALLLGRYFGKPVVVSARGTDINLFPKFPLIRRWIRRTLDGSDAVIAVCQALKDAMVDLEIPADKISVIPNGVDTAKFRPVPRDEARARLSLPAGRVLLSVGSLIPRKGFDLLIRAVRAAGESAGEELHLRIVGEGSQRAELERLIAEEGLQNRVRLVGPVPHDELYLWYSAADLFCLASSREGYPNVLVEALACGTPVVAAATWGVPEIVGSEEIGLLSERDVDALSAAIREGLDRTWDRERIAAQGRRRTWDDVSLALVRLFRSIAPRAVERGRARGADVGL